MKLKILVLVVVVLLFGCSKNEICKNNDGFSIPSELSEKVDMYPAKLLSSSHENFDDSRSYNAITCTDDRIESVISYLVQQNSQWELKDTFKEINDNLQKPDSDPRLMELYNQQGVLGNEKNRILTGEKDKESLIINVNDNSKFVQISYQYNVK